MSVPNKTTGLRVSGPTNSQLFTNCCGLAVRDMDKDCPGCGALVCRPVDRATLSRDETSPRLREEITVLAAPCSVCLKTHPMPECEKRPTLWKLDEAGLEQLETQAEASIRVLCAALRTCNKAYEEARDGEWRTEDRADAVVAQLSAVYVIAGNAPLATPKEEADRALSAVKKLRVERNTAMGALRAAELARSAIRAEAFEEAAVLVLDEVHIETFPGSHADDARGTLREAAKAIRALKVGP